MSPHTEEGRNVRLRDTTRPQRRGQITARLGKLMFAGLVATLTVSTASPLQAATTLDAPNDVVSDDINHVESEQFRSNDPLGIEMPTMDEFDYAEAEQGSGYEGVTTLLINVAGIADNRGKIILLAYDDEQAFNTGDVSAAVGHVEVAAKSGSVEVELPAYGVGPFAIFALHDADNDDELTVENGRPLEGYGVSGGLDPYSRAQNFARAASVQREVTVRIVYHSNPFR